MQEVLFEKIIEELKKERDKTFFVEPSNPQTQYRYGRSYRPLFDTAIKIVNEVAEEWNNGWIPVSERLPEERVGVDVTIMEDADEVGGKRYYNIRTWLQDGQFRFKKNPYNQVAIAWKYPTEPYQPKGDSK